MRENSRWNGFATCSKRWCAPILMWALFTSTACSRPAAVVYVPSQCLEQLKAKGPRPKQPRILATKDTSTGSVSFDALNAFVLGRYIEELEDWSDDAWRLCGPRPTTQPVRARPPSNPNEEVVQR